MLPVMTISILLNEPLQYENKFDSHYEFYQQDSRIKYDIGEDIYKDKDNQLKIKK